MNIRDVMQDPNLFGNQFSAGSWAAWRTLLAGFYGLPLEADERKVWQLITGRATAPKSAHDELWLVVGRRGGKSLAAALLAVYEAAFNDHTESLAPGERATVMVLAADRSQARSVFRYISGLLNENPMLRALIVREDKEQIELVNRTVIEVHTASFRSVRGYTIAAAICDEIAFWRDEGSANPDTEIINALRPAMATLGGKLICLSSPYARRGALWNAYRLFFGKPGSILVAQAPSRTMNPTLPQKVVDKAMREDLAVANAEYMAEFRTDVETFVSLDVIDECTAQGRKELPYISGITYHAFVDPSGGSKDAFTLAIAHRDENGIVIIDAVRSRKPPFSPESVVKEYAELLKSYRINRVTGDRYAGEWPREAFRNAGISYDVGKKPKSDLYRDLLPLLNSGQVELPDNEQLQKELQGLERRTSRGGRDSIDHAPNGHDDLANAVAGAAVYCIQGKASPMIARVFIDGPSVWASNFSGVF